MTYVKMPRTWVCETAQCKNPGTGWHSYSKSQDMTTQGTDKTDKDGRPQKTLLLGTSRTKPTWLENTISDISSEKYLPSPSEMSHCKNQLIKFATRG